MRQVLLVSCVNAGSLVTLQHGHRLLKRILQAKSTEMTWVRLIESLSNAIEIAHLRATSGCCSVHSTLFSPTDTVSLRTTHAVPLITDGTDASEDPELDERHRILTGRVLGGPLLEGVVLAVNDVVVDTVKMLHGVFNVAASSELGQLVLNTGEERSARRAPPSPAHLTPAC